MINIDKIINGISIILKNHEEQGVEIPVDNVFMPNASKSLKENRDLYVRKEVIKKTLDVDKQIKIVLNEVV